VKPRISRNADIEVIRRDRLGGLIHGYLLRQVRRQVIHLRSNHSASRRSLLFLLQYLGDPAGLTGTGR
jgi:hypothetical protein